VSDQPDLETEYAYLETDPWQEIMNLYAAASDIRAEMHDLRGEVAGITRICGPLGRLADLIGESPAAAQAFLSGIILAAADYTAGLNVRVAQLATQIVHIAGADQPPSRLGDKETP